MKNYKVKKYKNGVHDIIDIECTTVSFEKGSEAWWDAWLKENKIKSKFIIGKGGWVSPAFINVKKNQTSFDLHYDKSKACFDLYGDFKTEKLNKLNALGIYITSDEKDIYYKKPVATAFKKGVKCYSISINGVINEVRFNNSDEHNDLIRNKRMFTTFDEASKHTPKWSKMWHDIQREGELLTGMLQTAASIGSGLCNVDTDYFVVCYNYNNGALFNIYSKNIKEVNSSDEVFLKHALKFNTEDNANLFIKTEINAIEAVLH